jgi:hypothetical protein
MVPRGERRISSATSSTRDSKKGDDDDDDDDGDGDDDDDDSDDIIPAVSMDNVRNIVDVVQRALQDPSIDYKSFVQTASWCLCGLEVYIR